MAPPFDLGVLLCHPIALLLEKTIFPVLSLMEHAAADRTAPPFPAWL